MITFIVNPVAGNGRSLKAARQIKFILKYNYIQHKFYRTKYPYHAEKIVKRAIKEGADTIVAIGGDGTVLECARGLWDGNSRFNSQVAFGLIPVGSGNDFARSLEIPTDPVKALDIILHGHSTKIDVFDCNGHLALNIASIGIDAEIAAWTNRIKKYFGKISYLISVVKNIFTYKCFNGTISVGAQTITGPFTLAAIANGSYYGGGFQIAPMANLIDGELTLVVADFLPWYKMLVLFPLVPFGRHTKLRALHFENHQSIDIHFDKEYTLNIDGNLIETNGHVCFRIHPGAITVLHKNKLD